MHNLEQLARGRALVDRAIAESLAPGLDQCFNLRIIDPAHQKAQRITEQRERKTRKLPGPDMPGEKNDSPAAGTGRVDVFQAFTLNQTLQSPRVGGRELAEDSQQPAKILKTTAQ